ncbi:biotin transporter BioY [Baaleninema sp.]|uniref:biotin transporter BioY n=1 Tax=Baaleninema sp. TaxID=3101197 RepID=UPI003CFD4B68
MSKPIELLWAFIGLFLTILGTMVEASVANPLASLTPETTQTVSLGVTYQIGAVLLVGCLGGPNAGALSQIAYVTLGLTPWFPVFAQGGGLGYLSEPSFGYLLGFIPGAWLCGWLAFRKPCRVEFLGISCLAGLATVHGVGLLYAALLQPSVSDWWASANLYSWQPLPGQFAIACAVTVLSYLFRLLLFY